MNKNTKPANITATLAAGSTGTPYYYNINITQKLCRKTCSDDAPVFVPNYTLVGTSQVGTGQYIATIQVEGIISFIPCGCGSCNTRSQNLSQSFTIPFASASSPTAVSITITNIVNTVVPVSCSCCSDTFVSEATLNLNVTP